MEGETELALVSSEMIAHEVRVLLQIDRLQRELSAIDSFRNLLSSYRNPSPTVQSIAIVTSRGQTLRDKLHKQLTFSQLPVPIQSPF